MNFTAQACEIKRLKRAYNARIVIADGNGLGAGLVDECLKESIDLRTGESLGCWNTINTDNRPESNDYENCLFDMKAQSYQTKVITTFIDIVDSGKLRLLQKRKDNEFTSKEQENYEEKVLPYIQTDFLFEEIANLKLKTLPSGNLTVEKTVKKINKDRWSALCYCVFYIMEFTNNINNNDKSDLDLLEQYTFL
jgi:ribonucleoside-diphosphate reductase alpha chain